MQQNLKNMETSGKSREAPAQYFGHADNLLGIGEWSPGMGPTKQVIKAPCSRATAKRHNGPIIVAPSSTPDIVSS